jgi:hypothetical protein
MSGKIVFDVWIKSRLPLPGLKVMIVEPKTFQSIVIGIKSLGFSNARPPIWISEPTQLPILLLKNVGEK